VIGDEVFVDVVGGAAGDMLLAAFLDAGASEEAVRRAVEAVLPGRFTVELQEVRRAGLRATLLRIEDGPMAPPASPSEGIHGSRGMDELRRAVHAASVPQGVRTRVLAILGKLEAAEARVHGVPVEKLTLHELGDDDTLLDLVGAAAALEALGVERMFVSQIPLGDRSPAPATVELLKGFAVRSGGTGETITPTAAAIFSALGEPANAFPSMTISTAGVGAGNRNPPGYPNVVRVVVGRPAPPGEPVEGPLERTLSMLEANLDDLTPELVADAASALLAAGSLDVWTTPAVMKKGRSGVVLAALSSPENEVAVRRVFFEATSTFGVRVSSVRRAELERRVVSVSVDEGTVRVKLGLLAGRPITAKPEHDDVAELARASGRAVRDVHEQATAAARELRFERTET